MQTAIRAKSLFSRSFLSRRPRHKYNTSTAEFDQSYFSLYKYFSSNVPEEREAIPLDNRAVLRVQGKDSDEFLQGLITNDIGKFKNENTQSIYAMMLNIQGRALYDILLYKLQSKEDGESPHYLMECDRELAPEVLKHLKMYKIRKKVDISDASDQYKIYAVLQAPEFHSELCTLSVKDPRVEELGSRLVVSSDLPSSVFKRTTSRASYDCLRYRLGIAEGPSDIPPGSALPLESNLDYMNGVNFHKGCYIGQELTARNHYTGVVRKRLMPVVPARDSEDLSILRLGDKIATESGKNAGRFRIGVKHFGLALIRLEHRSVKLFGFTGNNEKIEITTSDPTWWPADAKR